MAECGAISPDGTNPDCAALHPGYGSGWKPVAPTWPSA